MLSHPPPWIYGQLSGLHSKIRNSFHFCCFQTFMRIYEMQGELGEGERDWECAGKLPPLSSSLLWRGIMPLSMDVSGMHKRISLWWALTANAGVCVCGWVGGLPTQYWFPPPLCECVQMSERGWLWFNNLVILCIPFCVLTCDVGRCLPRLLEHFSVHPIFSSWWLCAPSSLTIGSPYGCNFPVRL